MIKSFISDIREIAAICTIIACGLVGYPWLWFSGDEFRREQDRLGRFAYRIAGRNPSGGKHTASHTGMSHEETNKP